jgi:excisionase family DNA binding protein
MADFIDTTPAEPRIGRSVTIDRAAELLGCSRRTVYNWIRSGRLYTVRTLGRSQRVLIESLPRAAAQQARGGARNGNLTSV